MKTCQEIQKLCDAYVEGCLKGEEARTVEEHLKACRKCEQEMMALRKIEALCRDVPAPLLTHEEKALCWETIRQRLGLKEGVSSTEAAGLRQHVRALFAPRRLIAYGAAAAAALFLATVLSFLRTTENAQQEPGVIVSSISVESPDYVAILKQGHGRDAVPVLVLRRIGPEKPTQT